MKKTLTVIALIAILVVVGTGLATITRTPDTQQSASNGSAEMERDAHEASGAEANTTFRPIRQRVLAPAPLAPAVGWVGEVNVGSSDTWEPAIAADPSSAYVYTMYNRFGGPKACSSHCPSPAMMVRVSPDGGATWGNEKFLCTCQGVAGQYDPVLFVTSTGTAYATLMNSNTIVFTKSSDHGATWSTPLKVSGKSWGDKPWIGASANGVDVYIAFESRSVYYITSSHNSGATWSAPIKVNGDTGRYRYANGFAVLPNGTAVLSDSSYPGTSGKTSGQVDIEVWRTTNGGTSWSRVVVDSAVYTGVDFDTSSTTTIAADAVGSLVIEYSGAPTLGTNGHVWVRRSTDGGVTWSAATQLADGTGNASFPAITGGASGNFRLMWQDSRGGAWNTWYRASTDGGVTWSADLKISDATTGATYKTAAGYGGPYGDYNTIDITNAGKTVAVWGEGQSFSTGPGGIWFNRQT